MGRDRFESHQPLSGKPRSGGVFCFSASGGRTGRPRSAVLCPFVPDGAPNAPAAEASRRNLRRSIISAYLLRSLTVTLAVLAFPTRSQYLTLIAALAFLPRLTSRLSHRLAFLLFGPSSQGGALARAELPGDLPQPEPRLPAAGGMSGGAPPWTAPDQDLAGGEHDAVLGAAHPDRDRLAGLRLPLADSLARGGWVSTVKLRVAGLGSVLAASSVARTSNVWGPSVSARGAVGRVAGRVAAAVELALEAGAPLSGGEGEAWGGVVGETSGAGVDLGLGRGGVDREAARGGAGVGVGGFVGGPHLEAVGAVGSGPVREWRAAGRVAAAVEAALEARARLAGGEGEGRGGVVGGPAGPESIWVSGGTVSTVKLREAGWGRCWPASSVARTSKLWGPSGSGPVPKGELQAASSRRRRAALEAGASLVWRRRRRSGWGRW